jgi:predicted hotdog family 3-hydroxylacyl-ACP dehydratase
MTIPDIRSLLPHSGPMVLLDRVIAVDEESLCAEVRIRQNSLFCNAGGVGTWVGIEYMAQAIGAYAGYTAKLRGDPIRVGFLLGTRRYECCQPLFVVGSLLKVYVKRIFQSDNGLASFECHIDDGNEHLAIASITVFQPADAKSDIAGSST